MNSPVVETAYSNPFRPKSAFNDFDSTPQKYLSSYARSRVSSLKSTADSSQETKTTQNQITPVKGITLSSMLSGEKESQISNRRSSPRRVVDFNEKPSLRTELKSQTRPLSAVEDYKPRRTQALYERIADKRSSDKLEKLVSTVEIIIDKSTEKQSAPTETNTEASIIKAREIKELPRVEIPKVENNASLETKKSLPETSSTLNNDKVTQYSSSLDPLLQEISAKIKALEKKIMDQKTLLIQSQALKISSVKASEPQTVYESKVKASEPEELQISTVKASEPQKILESPIKLSQPIQTYRTARSQCNICFDPLYTLDTKVMYINDCYSRYHQHCVLAYVLNAINSSALPIRCPDENCSKGIDSNKLSLILSEEEFATYNKRLKYQQAIENPDKFAICPTAGCEHIFSIKPVVSGAEPERLECPACKQATCGGCKMKFHQNLTCAENMSYTAEDFAVCMLLEGNKWKKCMKCRFWIEKNEGCNHMTCKCTNQFCYICSAPWKTCSCG